MDNSVGENPPPVLTSYPHGPLVNHADLYARIRGRDVPHQQSPAYLTGSPRPPSARPKPDANALMRYPVKRTYWKEALFATDVPVLYVVRPGWKGQADHLLKDRPNPLLRFSPTRAMRYLWTSGTIQHPHGGLFAKHMEVRSRL